MFSSKHSSDYGLFICSGPLSTSPLCPQLVYSHILDISWETPEYSLCGQWLASIPLCIWSVLLQAPFGLCLASSGDEMICLRRERWEEPGAALRHQTQKKTLIEREAQEPVINHNSTRTHCWNPTQHTKLLSWLQITIAGRISTCGQMMITSVMFCSF